MFGLKKKLSSMLERSPASRVWRGHEAWLGLFAVVVIGFCCLSYSPKVARIASEQLSGNKYLALIDGMFNPLRNRHLLLNSGFPIYDLKMSHRERATLEDVAERAKAHGWMSDDLKIWANGQFVHEGERFPVKVRLRGDLGKHWRGPKKSYRIKFTRQQVMVDGKTVEEPVYFQGKHQINLILPHDKLFALGMFINSVLREAGLVVPRDQFVVLRINGVIHGLYYEVEQFEKPLLAAHRRPETAVFGQNNRAMRYEKYTKIGAPGAADANFDMGSVRRQVERADDLGMRAMQVLIDHSLDPSEENFERVRAVLDWEKYLRFRIMTTMCNTNHVRFGSDNLKLYYDSSRGLFEPIPWDVLLVKMPKEPGTVDYFNQNGPDEIQRAMLQDPELRLRRNRMMWEMLSDGGKSFLARYDSLHNRIRSVVWADVLSTPVQGHKMDIVRKTLRFNVRRAHHVLSYSSGNLNYRLESHDQAAVEFASLNFSGIQLRGMSFSDSLVFDGPYRLYEDSNNDGALDASDTLVDEAEAYGGEVHFRLDRRVLPVVEYGSDLIQNRHWEFFHAGAGRVRFFLEGRLARENRHPIAWAGPRITVDAFNVVTERRVASYHLDDAVAAPDSSIGIRVYDGSDAWDLEAQQKTIAEFLADHPQFRACAAQPGAVELRGRVTLNGTIFVPKSVPLVLQPGTEVTMAAGASVVCYGGLTSVGTPADHIRIRGDASGRPWGTFAVVRPNETVRVEYTEFMHGGQAQANGILFTGGFAVHEGDLEIHHSRFVRMRSEDAINIKNGHIEMSHCVIQETASDAIDIDVGTGTVRSSQFSDISGDGIDISYSEVTLADNRLQNVRDKGISVGEQSRPTILNNLIENCGIGISCKDLSRAKVGHCTFVNNRLAIEAKRKKPMFGGGSGEFVNCVFADNDSLLSEDHHSKGNVTIKSSMVDGIVAGETEVTARFVDPESGDYRLEAVAPHGPAIEMIDADWMDFTTSPGMPGIFGSPSLGSVPNSPPSASSAESHVSSDAWSRNLD